MVNEAELVQAIVAELDADRKEKHKQALVNHINYLLLHDFEKLINVLYRVDVDETKLKKLLNINKEHDAATIIAELMINRQKEKVLHRKTNPSENNIDDAEKW